MSAYLDSRFTVFTCFMLCGCNKTVLYLPTTLRHNIHVINYLKYDTGQSTYIRGNAMKRGGASSAGRTNCSNDPLLQEHNQTTRFSRGTGQ
jgi:hypothetical protein